MLGSKQRRLNAALKEALRDYLAAASAEVNEVILPMLHLERTPNHKSYTIGVMDGENLVAIEVEGSNIASIGPGLPSVMMHVPLEIHNTLDDIIRHFYAVPENVRSDDHRALIAIARCAKLYVLTPHHMIEHLWPADQRIKDMAAVYYDW